MEGRDFCSRFLRPRALLLLVLLLLMPLMLLLLLLLSLLLWWCCCCCCCKLVSLSFSVFECCLGDSDERTTRTLHGGCEQRWDFFGWLSFLLHAVVAVEQFVLKATVKATDIGRWAGGSASLDYALLSAPGHSQATSSDALAPA